MSACLSKHLYNQNEIDLVICFAPTIQVVSSFTQTMEEVLGSTFDGRLGSLGGAFTYQAMAHRDERFWDLFDQYRVLVIFDEIHHCAAQEALAGNVWGQQIADRIQAKARFTLALSGTPWRTDDGLVALARYTDAEGELVRDYVYGLEQAIKDQVCRTPRIVLLDNEHITRTEVKKSEELSEQFLSIKDLLFNTDTKYQEFLEQEKAIEKVLEIANEKLNELRKSKPDAAGLIVASNVAHANQIANSLQNQGESPVVVNYQNSDAQKHINAFRHADTRWIVSVGMISEGTDIPRLQVCCYLSRVRTELYLRQVLGRILRRSGHVDALAWLYLYVEPKLEEFCNRIQIDLPSDPAVVSKLQTEETHIPGLGSQADSAITDDIAIDLESGPANTEVSERYGTNNLSAVCVSLHLSDMYVQRVLNLFCDGHTPMDPTIKLFK